MPRHQLVAKAVEAGFRVWSLWDPSRTTAEHLRKVAEFSEELLLADFGDERELRKVVVETAQRHDLAHVLDIGSRRPVLAVLEEAWRLGLAPTSPEVVARLETLGSGRAREPGERGFAVETLSIDGGHHVIGITARGASGYVHPAPLRDDERRAIERLALDTLEEAGYTFGPAHTEIAVPGEEGVGGARVTLATPSLGADRIPLLVGIACGFDIEAAVLEALVGRAVEVPPAERYSEIGFFRLPPGRLRTVAGIDSICALPYIRAVDFPFREGDLVPDFPESGARHGYVVVAGESPEEAGRRTRTALGLLRADIRP